MIVAILPLYESELWIRQSVASYFNHIDRIVAVRAGFGGQEDNTKLYLDWFNDIEPKITYIDCPHWLASNDTERTNTGLAHSYNLALQVARYYGAEWIFKVDHDNIFYPSIRTIREWAISEEYDAFFVYQHEIRHIAQTEGGAISNTAYVEKEPSQDERSLTWMTLFRNKPEYRFIHDWGTLNEDKVPTRISIRKDIHMWHFGQIRSDPIESEVWNFRKRLLRAVRRQQAPTTHQCAGKVHEDLSKPSSLRSMGMSPPPVLATDPYEYVKQGY